MHDSRWQTPQPAHGEGGQGIADRFADEVEQGGNGFHLARASLKL